jgi:hypothetical protein
MAGILIFRIFKYTVEVAGGYSVESEDDIEE